VFISTHELAKAEFPGDDLAYLFCPQLGHLIPLHLRER
jgi:hypothetical protein